MQIIFNIVATLLSLVLGILWAKKKWIDIFVKILFIILTICGCVLIATHYGYIIKH